MYDCLIKIKTTTTKTQPCFGEKDFLALCQVVVVCVVCVCIVCVFACVVCVYSV